jgi:hypothetical protein
MYKRPRHFYASKFVSVVALYNSGCKPNDVKYRICKTNSVLYVVR